MAEPLNRKFLMLQGPHGPFFSRLAQLLRNAQTDVWRIGFNAGDERFWQDKSTYVPFLDTLDKWPDFFADFTLHHGITDIVIYGDTRPVHALALEIARQNGLTVHVFEEGYLRPYWVTYERGGSNGNSRLMDMSVSDMQSALAKSNLDVPEAPAHWGDVRQHAYYGFAYHLQILLKNRKYKNMRSHRALSVAEEFRAYLRRVALHPFEILKRGYKTLRIKNSGVPYHLALMQLEHDSAFQMHSPFSTMPEFLREVIRGFAKGAPKHHHLVFKAHPMESGKRPMEKIIDALAIEYGVTGRVHYIPGGKLAQLLDHARTAVTVNSTAAQQVLWRGIPLKTFGTAVYEKPEFVSQEALSDFFANPSRPNNLAYKEYRRYLLETSQIAGGFYSAKGRRQLLRQVVDMMLSKRDPYDAFENGDLGPRQQHPPQLLRLVK